MKTQLSIEKAKELDKWYTKPEVVELCMSHIDVSEYDNVYDLDLITQYKHHSTLNSTAHNEVIEKLFCNKK